MKHGAFFDSAKLLRAFGLRITPVREKLLSILEIAESPISVQDILTEITKTRDINKTTVYRDLDRFVRAGFVREIVCPDGARRFELSRGAGHHHVVCVSCGMVVCMDLGKELEGVRMGLKKKGFTFGDVVALGGRCGRCE